MEQSTFHQQTLDLLAYMITSARGLLDEPASYGPLRLIDGASRLCALFMENSSEDAQFFTELKNKIDQRKFSLMTDPAEFNALLDEAVLDITRRLISNSGQKSNF